MRWLTDVIATGAYNEVSRLSLDNETVILDVRDLVDKSGNSISYIFSKIEEGLKLLRNNKKIIVCCDYGMSRSNSIAIGIMVRLHNMTFSEAANITKGKVEESGIKIEMLNTVYNALYGNKKRPGETKNILVTGGSGFLGKGIISQLQKRFTISAPGSKDINLLSDSISLDLLVKSENIDTVLHLANPKIFTTNQSTGDTLVMLKNVLDICRTNNAKLIFLSGWEIYSGYRSTGLISNESLAPNPKGTYGETKWLCELLIRQYADNYGLKYQILRSGPVYGAIGDKPKFIYNFIDKALKEKKIVTHKYLNGYPSLDLLYIEDLISLIVKVVDSDFTGELNIGSGSATSTFTIAKLICEILNSDSEIQSADIDENAPNIIMDTLKVNSLFNWKPQIDLKQGLELVIKNYKSNNR